MTADGLDVDIAVIGAGPTGLYGAYYAGVRGLSTTLIDSLPEVGGQVAAMYPEKAIYDVAGFPGVRGRELVSRLDEQAERYAPVRLLGRRAERLERYTSGDGEQRFVVHTSDGIRVSCRAVILTCGIGTFTPRPLPAGRGHLGRGVSYFVRNLDEMADADVVVVGGGDSACDWALALDGVARSVALVHRRADFRAHEASVAALSAGAVSIHTNAQVTDVYGDEVVESVEISQGGRTWVQPAQRVIAALGFVADLGPLRSWGLELADNRHIMVDTRMQTTLRGVFAAGDVTEYPGKVRLMSVGFGEVATAINNAAAQLDPSAALFPGHSSDNAPAAPSLV